MQHALILTKNTVSEEGIIGKLRRLNYETLCSTDLLYHLQKYVSSSFFTYFHWVFLSETLCNEEVDLILNQLKNYPVFLVRIVEKTMDDEEIAYWEEKGMSGSLKKDATFEEIREKLHELQKELRDKQIINNKIVVLGNAEKDGLKPLTSRLSKTEKKLFENLLNAYSKGIVLSRVELCERLWPEGSTPSNMSQLSCLINKLKRKLEEGGITGETIITLWGRGYKLGSELSEFWIQHA
ncbi:winged helix-turn-helix domain-containing protein [Candidatus Enterococcus ferrettii]|uniref:OmpR/PhoB-type domain-containing protein n=1 Tax=Candidatus Enterococcus ferrettii TaxID=2815324 RepID=A0ABV0EQ84_9ENTE|nr:helix-turn-helix domain-containing protein [Enterococcus sp. 665A]MBO1341013.1 winged helix-turn-helix domain-containing protein [Enterococcus sp. 665A]